MNVYYKSKEELLEAVIEKMVDDEIERMQWLIKEMKGSALENVRADQHKEPGRRQP